MGSRLKIKIGLVALAFAFVLGTTAGGLSANGVVALFPVTLFFNFFLATFLFGFAGKNGTLKLLAAHLLYACRGVGWMMGLLFFAVTVIVAAMGAGGSAPFFLSPICFGLAMQAGIASILVPLAVWTGSMVGGSVPWTAGYATNIGQLEIYFDAAASKSYVMNFFTFRAVFYTILYVVLFLVFRGWKAKKLETVSLEKPESFNAKQKKDAGDHSVYDRDGNRGISLTDYDQSFLGGTDRQDLQLSVPGGAGNRDEYLLEDGGV